VEKTEGSSRWLTCNAHSKGYLKKVPERYDYIKDFLLQFQKKAFMKRMKNVILHW
jgi:hypothetical protein